METSWPNAEKFHRGFEIPASMANVGMSGGGNQGFAGDANLIVATFAL
jgi:hypothetical protein